MELLLNLEDFRSIRAGLNLIKPELEKIEKVDSGDFTFDALGKAYDEIKRFMDQWGTTRTRIFSMHKDIDELAEQVVKAFENIDEEIRKNSNNSTSQSSSDSNSALKDYERRHQVPTASYPGSPIRYNSTLPTELPKK